MAAATKPSDRDESSSSAEDEANDECSSTDSRYSDNDDDDASATESDGDRKPTDAREKSKKKNDDEAEEKSKDSAIECPVCLGTAVYPVRIPCGHVFCFLCVKGAARQAKKCPMCRQQIPTDFDKNPTVLAREEAHEAFEDGFQWFYEGKNGWWQYEKRTSEEIEQNHKLNNKKFDLLICGTIYTIDLDRNVQYNRENPHRRRKIKRENANNIAVKGVAGVH